MGGGQNRTSCPEAPGLRPGVGTSQRSPPEMVPRDWIEQSFPVYRTGVLPLNEHGVAESLVLETKALRLALLSREARQPRRSTFPWVEEGW